MTLDQLVFSFKGRINRSKYWNVCIAMGLCFWLLGLGLMSEAKNFLPPECREIAARQAQKDCIEASKYQPPENAMTILWVTLGVELLVLVLGLWITTAVTVKRYHDLNQTGFLVLLGFVPFLNIALGIWLGFFKGTVGDNKYGADPINEPVIFKL